MAKVHSRRGAFVLPYSERAQIPLSKGLYGFSMDLAQTSRALLSTGNWSAFDRLGTGMQKEMRKGFSVNLSGLPEAYRQSLDFAPPSHRIHAPDPGLDAERLGAMARMLRAAQPLLPPLYIGIADKQTLGLRYQQHHDDYHAALSDDTLAQAGAKFGHRLVARRLEWRDLLFVYIPCEEDELELLPVIEKVLQAIVNPGLSVSH